jgi:hypothetical protein
MASSAWGRMPVRELFGRYHGFVNFLSRSGPFRAGRGESARLTGQQERPCDKASSFDLEVGRPGRWVSRSGNTVLLSKGEHTTSLRPTPIEIITSVQRRPGWPAIEGLTNDHRQ